MMPNTGIFPIEPYPSKIVKTHDPGFPLGNVGGKIKKLETQFGVLIHIGVTGVACRPVAPQVLIPPNTVSLEELKIANI